MASTPDDEVLGPIDYLLLQYPPGADTTASGAALVDLVAGATVRILDLIVIRKHDDGSFSGLDITDVSDHGIGGFVAFEGARSGLVDDDDLSEASQVMDPGTTAVLVVYENTWARGFVSAARDAQAEVIASARIPADEVMAALDALDAATAS
jgi:dihydroorotase-like cyclic amidohydrolase